MDATRARDSLNNMEQVTFTNPSSGNISVDVSEFNIPSGSQKFFIVYHFVMDEVEITYPMGGEGLVPGQTEYLRWDASQDLSNFKVDFSADAGATWSTIAASVSANERYRAWSVSNVPTHEGKIRVIAGRTPR
ncbi:MAG: hypothetical protein U5L96_05705 [Owenweeksia sp.]|nr:hypothetical protein [Owenweeksia sp.]